ncbi:MAG: nuclear transport factor 2 family protein [Myxococcota bacterium]
MHPNAQLLTGFYEAFARKDAGPMRAAYADDARFSDPAFPDLRGKAIGDMWAMLCERAQDFSLTFRDVQADDAKGSAHWEARYLFGGKRKVHNVIEASFTFRDGRIVQHTDSFDFHRWSRQALGPAGLLLGWSGFLKRQVQGRSAKLLASWQRRGG